MEQDPYDKPVVVDYGTLVEITKASGFNTTEDGANKNHFGSSPAGP